jgi:hypothetical protein
MHGRAQTRTHARTALARAQAHAQREDHRTARANTQPGVNAASTRRQRDVNAEARAHRFERLAYAAGAHGRYRRVGSAQTSAAESAVETAAESQLPIACAHARTHASSTSYAIGRCCDAQVSATAARPNCPLYLAMYPPIYAQTNAHAFSCIHRKTNTSYAHTHGCSGVCGRAGEMQGEGGARGGEGEGGPWSICRDAEPCAAVPSNAARPSGCTRACGRAASAPVVGAEAIPATAATRIRRRCCARSRRSGGHFAATGTAEVANGCSANQSAEVGIVGIGVS